MEEKTKQQLEVYRQAVLKKAFDFDNADKTVEISEIVETPFGFHVITKVSEEKLQPVPEDVAKEAGADIVKFQTAKLDSLVSKNAHMAEYQKKNTGKEESQKEMLSKLLLSFDDFVELAEYCRQVGIQFLSTPFDIESIYFLSSMQDIWKVPSGEITNYPYLVEIGKTGKKVILSTGMATLDEIDAAIELYKDNIAVKTSYDFQGIKHNIQLNSMEYIYNMNNPFNYEDVYDFLMGILKPAAYSCVRDRKSVM